MTSYPLLGLILIATFDLFSSRVLPLLPVSRIVCGPDTTVATSPVRPDGTIDYEAAYNSRAAVGVTPENNAAVLLERAFGPEQLSEELRSKFYRNLGIDELPLSGDYFHFSDEAIGKLIEVPDSYGGEHNHLGLAAQRMWTRKEFPEVAATLDANRLPLGLLEQASRKSKFYYPFVTKYWIFGAPVWIVGTHLKIGTRLLRVRAMLKLSDGDADGAVEDLLVCQRLVRLFAQSPISQNSAYTVAEISRSLGHNLEVLLSQPLTLQQLERFQTAFREVPIAIDTIASLDLYQRFAALDYIQETWIRMYSFGMFLQKSRRSWVDINAAMRRCNSHYDRVLLIQKLKDSAERQHAIRLLEEEVKAQSDIALARLSSHHVSTFPIAESRQLLSEAFTDWTMEALGSLGLQIQTTNCTTRMQDELGIVGFALAVYRAKHGKYPDRLGLLVPQFLERIPDDRFDAGPISYRLQPQGYLLYSIGDDKKDDGGRPADWESGDLTFEIKHPESEAERAARYRELEREMLGRVPFSPQQKGIFFAILILIQGCVIWRFIVLWSSSKLTIGPDTTIVAGPIKADGTVDFEAALYARSSVGVTIENNAATLLAQVFTFQELPPELRSRYYHYLGISEPTTGEVHFLDESGFVSTLTAGLDGTRETTAAIVEEMSQGLAAPWSRVEFPRIAAWVEVNQNALQLVRQASLRPAFYEPLVNVGPLWKASSPLLQPLGAATRLLGSRAMLRIAESDLQGAIDDLLTCHRLARLLGRSSTAAANLLGTTIDAVAIHCSQYLFAQSLTGEQIEFYRAELTSMIAVTDITATLETAVRLEMLDGIQSAARNRKQSRELLGFRSRFNLDLNPAFRRTNSYFDLLRSVLRTPEGRDRFNALNDFIATHDENVRRQAAGLKFVRRLAVSSRKVLNQSIADLMLRNMLPDLRQLQAVEHRAFVRREMLRLGLALAAYRRVQGSYPAKMEELTSDFLSQIPLDPYSGKPLQYQRHSLGYMIKSSGTGGGHESVDIFQVVICSRNSNSRDADPPYERL